MGQKTFTENITSTIRGFELAEKIISNDQTVHYLIMDRHIGDVMRMLKLVIQFKKYYSETEPYFNEKRYGKLFRKAWVVKKVVVITDDVHAGVAKLFSSVDGIITLPTEELRDIGFYAKSFICVHPNLHRDEYGSPGDELLGEDLERHKLFGVSSYNWVLDLPMNFPAKNEWILSDMKLKNESLEKALEVFQIYRTVPEATVVICPYAKSSSILSEEYWNIYVDSLQKYNYIVFTNSGCDEEKPLKNTIALHVSIDTLVAMGCLGSMIAGVQSGLLDTIRGFSPDIKLLAISCLNTPYDYMLASNRKLENQIERRKNVTHLLLKKEDPISDILAEQFSYYRKGRWQLEKYREIKRDDLSLYTKNNLNDYVKELVNISNIIVFLAVYDSANKYWTSFERSLLGLESDLSVEWRKSYIAVVDREKDFLYEQMNSNFSDISFQGTFSDINRKTEYDELDFPEDNRYYISSHAMGKGRYTKAVVVINGEQYALNKRGLNIVVFSREANHVIDSIYVDFWADSQLTIQREKPV